MTEEGPFGYHLVKDPEFPALQGFANSPTLIRSVSCRAQALPGIDTEDTAGPSLS